MSEHEKSGHVQYACPQPCQTRDLLGTCVYCDGGLFFCTECGGAEGSLPSTCPGYQMTLEEQNLVYDEKLDFRGGKWYVYINTADEPDENPEPAWVALVGRLGDRPTVKAD